MRGAIPLLPLYAFIVWTGTLPWPLSYQYKGIFALFQTAEGQQGTTLSPFCFCRAFTYSSVTPQMQWSRAILIN
jgi:hypothetical protein